MDTDSTGMSKDGDNEDKRKNVSEDKKIVGRVTNVIVHDKNGNPLPAGSKVDYNNPLKMKNPPEEDPFQTEEEIVAGRTVDQEASEGMGTQVHNVRYYYDERLERYYVSGNNYEVIPYRKEIPLTLLEPKGVELLPVEIKPPTPLKLEPIRIRPRRIIQQNLVPIQTIIPNPFNINPGNVIPNLGRVNRQGILNFGINANFDAGQWGILNRDTLAPRVTAIINTLNANPRARLLVTGSSLMRAADTNNTPVPANTSVTYGQLSNNRAQAIVDFIRNDRRLQRRNQVRNAGIGIRGSQTARGTIR